VTWRSRLEPAWPGAPPGWPPTATAAAIGVLTAALVPLSLLARQDVLSNVSQDAQFLPLGAAGWLIARRQPRNPIGWLSWRRTGGERRQQLKWLLSGCALSLALGIPAVLTGVFDLRAPAAGVVIGVLNDFSFIALAACLWSARCTRRSSPRTCRSGSPVPRG
jgi:hypothetical protein